MPIKGDLKEIGHLSSGRLMNCRPLLKNHFLKFPPFLMWSVGFLECCFNFCLEVLSKLKLGKHKVFLFLCLRIQTLKMFQIVGPFA